MRLHMDTSIFLSDDLDAKSVTRQRDSVVFRGFVDVPQPGVDLGLGMEGVRTHDRELCYRVVDVKLHRGDVLSIGTKSYRVATEPQDIDDGAFAVVMLKP